MSDSTNVPSKRIRLTCNLNCSEEDPQAKLISPQDFESWQTLLHAAEIRKHTPVLDLTKDLPDGRIPSIHYHRQCRSTFTLKKSLNAIEDSDKSTIVDTQSVTDQLISAGATSYKEDKCIFCQKDKYRKHEDTRESLVQCSELRSDSAVREAAIRKMDNQVIVLLSRELVAIEGHYHRSCYRDYTRVEKEVSSTIVMMDIDERETDAETMYENTLRQAHQELFSFIRNELFLKPDVVSMIYLTSMLTTKLANLGIRDVTESTKKNLRRTLEYEFGETLSFVKERNGRLLVFPSSLTVDHLAKEYFAIREQLKLFKSQTEDSTLSKAALQLREAVKTQDVNTEWPPDTQKSNCCVPESVGSFFKTLLTGETDSPCPPERVKRLSTSFGQDLVYAVTNGKEKPPKQILLPFAVKSLTGNVELIHILNRLGHGVSYSKLEEIDTALSLQKLSLPANQVPLPSDIHPSVFTTLAWDNIDRLEETLSGGGTSHRVNGIAVQRRFIGPQPPRIPNTAQNIKTKKRSISPDTSTTPVYNAGKRPGPRKIETVERDTTEVVHCAIKKNMVWVLTRQANDCQGVASWTGFNIQVQGDVDVVGDTVAYLPTVNSPATHLSTVYEVLSQSVNVMTNLQLNSIVCVFDQALYAKALEVAWKHQDKFGCIIPRMGVFHTICTLLAVVGKRFGDAGLRDLFVESGVVADGSISGVLEGRKYNRAVRIHKLMYEALMRLAWEEFLEWTENAERDNTEEALLVLRRLADDVSPQTLDEVMSNPTCRHVMQLFEQYLDFLRTGNGKLSEFWMSYIDIIEILLGLLRSTREGDWILHLGSIREMIPWCFAYDRQNYARYLPVYYAEMSRLQLDHPEVYEHFMNGGFSVQLGEKNPFGRIPVDQTLEETVNKDTQTPGGTKGFSLNPGAVRRYYLNAEYRSSYLRQIRNMTDLGSSRLNHADLQPSRIVKDMADIQSLIDLMQNAWINPFLQEQDALLNIATGTQAPADVTGDLLNAKKIGQQAYDDFKRDRLEKDHHDPMAFHAKMKKQGLKTFTNIGNKKVSCKGKDIIIKADRNLFGRLIVIAQCRQLDMREVFAHSLGPLPWALTNEDGSLRKTDKAKLLNHIGTSVPPAEALPNHSACIIDGMSVIQKMNGSSQTFGELAKSALKLVLHEGDQCQRIDVVFDVYLETSIKDVERSNRGSGTGAKFRTIVAGHKIKQWRNFLSEAENKTRLIQFLVEEWKSSSNREMVGSKQLYVTCGEMCWKITSGGCCKIPELFSSQEEADTRVILHAKHAADSGYPSVVIVSEDTDVFVLCLSFAKEIPCRLYQKRGTKTRTQFLDITKLRDSLGADLCDALIGLHAFTGCDTVSAFVGRGKKGPMDRLRSSRNFQETFSSLGKRWDVSDELFTVLQHFTCLIYAPSSNTKQVNELRYKMFLAKRGEVESSLLPPCKDSLLKHAMRANYQAGVWRRSLKRNPDVPDPAGHGWKKGDDGILRIDWLHGMPAPEGVMEMIACQCKRVCKSETCICIDNMLKCTPMCKLQNCGNKYTDDTEREDTADIDSDSGDDCQ